MNWTDLELPFLFCLTALGGLGGWMLLVVAIAEDEARRINWKKIADDLCDLEGADQ